MHLLHIPIYFHTYRQQVDEYTKLELDQQSRLSRIRRDTQTFDEELARQAVLIDHSRSIA
ncbi:MAG: hypothetical protein Q7R42_03895 [Candidatus Planktophila sp.]|nr:hypothetical protein [Candidatus Planktophila sp.]